MIPRETEKLRHCADAVWRMAEEARQEGHRELERVLKAIADAMHARARGRNGPFEI